MPLPFNLSSSGRAQADLLGAITAEQDGLGYTTAGAVAAVLGTPNVFAFWGFNARRLCLVIQETDPATFYYQSGMKFSNAGQLYGNTTLPIAYYQGGIPVAANGTVCFDSAGLALGTAAFLAHWDGTNGFTGPFPSAIGATLTTSVATNTLSTATQVFGTASLRLDGTLTAPITFPALAGAGDVVFEGFIRLDNLVGSLNVIDLRVGGGDGLLWTGSGQLLWATTASGTNLFTSATLTALTWYYWAMARTSGLSSFFLGTVASGVANRLTAPVADTANYQCNGSTWGSGAAYGNLDETRFSYGGNRGYTGTSIAVPVAAFTS